MPSAVQNFSNPSGPISASCSASSLYLVNSFSSFFREKPLGPSCREIIISTKIKRYGGRNSNYLRAVFGLHARCIIVYRVGPRLCIIFGNRARWLRFYLLRSVVASRRFAFLSQTHPHLVKNRIKLDFLSR